MSETLLSTFETVIVTSLIGWGLISFMGLVTKNIDQKKLAQERLDKEKALSETFKKD